MTKCFWFTTFPTTLRQVALYPETTVLSISMSTLELIYLTGIVGIFSAISPSARHYIYKISSLLTIPQRN